MAKKKKSAGGKQTAKSGGATRPSLQDLYDMMSSVGLQELAELARSKDPMFRQLLDRLGEASLGDMVEYDDSPMGRAIDLLYEAEDAGPKRRAQAARKALKICPECVEAHGILGDLAATDEEALAHYRTAVETGWRNLGEDPLRDYGENFWQAVETQPFMVAKRNLAEFLWETGNVDEAALHYRELLDLNPNDNQGVRYELANLLLSEDRRAALKALLDCYCEDGSPEFAYSAALLAFREEGDTVRSRKLLRAAKKTNRHVPAYLTGKRELPTELPEYFSPGGKDEAVSYASANLRNWTETDGAVPWLRKVFKMNVIDPDKVKRAPKNDRWLRIADDLPQNEDEVWQVDAAPMSDVVDGDVDLAPWMCAIAYADEGTLVNFDMSPERPTEEELLTFVLQSMAADDRREPARPAAIEVCKEAFHRAWSEPLGKLGIDLILCDELPACDEALRESTDATGVAERLAGVLSDAAEGNLPPPETLPQHVNEFWLADLRPLATWFDDGGTLIRPQMAMVVDTTSETLLMQDVVMDEQVDEDRLWRVLLAAMHGPQEGQPRRPGKIGFRTREIADRFGPRLAEAEIESGVCDDLGPIDFMADELGRRMCGPDAPPALVDVPGMTHERLRVYFEAAATFRQRAVWRSVPTDGVLRIERIQPAGAPWFGAVMGQSGMTYGVALYESLEDMLRLMSGRVTTNEEAARISALSITFGEAFDIAPRDLIAQEQQGWPVAGKEGYPTITRVNQGGSMRPPLVWELELATACLAALPDFRYRAGATTTATTPIGDGDVTLRLKWLNSLDD